MKYKLKVQEMVSKISFEKLEKYVDLIEKYNKVMNLTGFTQDRLWEEGIYESIFVLQKGIGKHNNLKILDIGAGAGFPSVPFLIAFPQNELTIFEPLQKRIKFLEIVKKELDLNINLINIRAEEVRIEEEFDLVTARAVASLRVLSEISHKPAKIGATFAFFKGPKYLDEIEDAKKIFKILNIDAKVKKVDTESRENYLVLYKKKNKTPTGYPRTWKEIK